MGAHTEEPLDILAIVGSRSAKAFIIHLSERPDKIISGAAEGADTAAKHYAMANGIPFEEFPPNYNLFGRKAPLVRNTTIAKTATRLLAYWDGRSKGTADVMNKARRRGIPVEVVNVEPAT